MSKVGDKLIAGMQEAAEIARGEKPAARVRMNGHDYVPMKTALADCGPDEISAAWAAWKSRHGGKLGPGTGFVEAINAAFEARRRALKGRTA